MSSSNDGIPPEATLWKGAVHVMAMGNAEHQPLLSGDASASTFGTGQVVSSDGHSITYSGSHRYVLSQYFDSDTTNSSPSVRTALTPAPYDGRDFQGQVLKTIDSTTYIQYALKPSLY